MSRESLAKRDDNADQIHARHITVAITEANEG